MFAGVVALLENALVYKCYASPHSETVMVWKTYKNKVLDYVRQAVIYLFCWIILLQYAVRARERWEVTRSLYVASSFNTSKL